MQGEDASESDGRLIRHLLAADGACLSVGRTVVTVRLDGKWSGSLDDQPFWVLLEQEKDEQGNWLRIPLVHAAVRVVGRAQLADGMEQLNLDRQAIAEALEDGDWVEATM